MFVVKNEGVVEGLEKKLAERLFRLSLYSTIAIILLAVLAFIGWQIDSSFLKSLNSSSVSMNPLTAICFIFLGISLLLLRVRDQKVFHIRLGKVIALLVFSIGISKLSIYLGLDFRIDRVFFTNRLDGNQMAPNTALCFILCSLSLLFIDFKMGSSRQLISQIFTLFTLFITVSVFTGYIYQSEGFITIGGFFPMAFNTVIGFFLFILSIFGIRANGELTKTIIAASAGGIMSRSLIPFVFILPIGLGWLRLKGEEEGLFDLQFGTSLFTSAIISLFLVLIWRTSHLINVLDEAYGAQTQMLRAILEKIGDGVVVANKEGHFTLFNAAAEKIMGMSAIADSSEKWSSVYGVFKEDMSSLFASEDLPLVKAIRGIETDGVVQFIRNPKKPGGAFINVTGRPIYDSNQEIVGGVVTIRDITQQKLDEVRIYEITSELKAQNIELYARSHSASKMASLGEMAAGVGHEVNNPLTAIIGGADDLLEHISDGKLERETIVNTLKSIKSTALRIAKIVRSLKSFARDGSNDPAEECSLQKIFDETAELCRERIRYKDIDLIIDSVAPYTKILCRPTEMIQVLLNLIGNSQDAIKDRHEKWIRLSFLDAEDHFEISVTDSGLGISPDIYKKIFQPFFTTKEVGRGTGLGLSISREMIARNGGTLELDLQSVNTRFIIRLPKSVTKRMKV